MAKISEGSAQAPKKGSAVQANGSALESLRRNPVGTLLGGLVVALAVGLLLSVLVPEEPNVLALILLGLFEAAAVGFAVRALAADRGLVTQVVALILTVLGVHVMVVTGMAGGGPLGAAGFGGGGVGFGDSLLVALATPAASAGGVIAGLVAVVIVGWGRPTTR